MFNIHSVEIDWGGRPLKLETGKIARQADGAVLATYGETVVLATVVAAKTPREGVDFLPLTVDYQEKTYAAGRIPGGYFKREGRPTEKETLVSRLIDRPVRPLFAPGWRNETQVIVTTLSHDLENDPDVLAMIASSAALTLSGAPFMGPIGAARVGFVNNEYVLNPQLDEMPESQLDLVVAGTQDAVLMVESEAKELSEEIMLGAVMFGHRHAPFTRGETQSLVIATLGTGEDEQFVDALPGTYKETFLLHYNFPPFSVGETGRFGAPGRREVGHGKLAWRAIHPMLPAHH